MTPRAVVRIAQILVALLITLIVGLLFFFVGQRSSCDQLSSIYYHPWWRKECWKVDRCTKPGAEWYLQKKCPFTTTWDPAGAAKQREEDECCISRKLVKTITAKDIEGGFETEKGSPAFEYARLRKLADSGNAEAQESIGDMYWNGRGVKEDWAEAVSWYRKAADQGLSKAQTSVGNMYWKGEGINQDYVEANFWFILAKNAGDKEASWRAEYTEKNLTAEQKAAVKKRVQEWRPVAALIVAPSSALSPSWPN